MAAPSSSAMVSPMPPNGHSTANSKVSAGGSGHSHSPNPLKPSSRPCIPLLPGDQDSSGPAGGSAEAVSGAGAARWWWPSCRRRSARPAAAACPAAGRRRAIRAGRHAPTGAGPTSHRQTARPAGTRPPHQACSLGGKPGSPASEPPRSRYEQPSAQRRAPRRSPALAAQTTAGVPAISVAPALPRPARARKHDLTVCRPPADRTDAATGYLAGPNGGRPDCPDLDASDGPAPTRRQHA
jgi:hypothetical protein